jgi:hypothetical protein
MFGGWRPARESLGGNGAERHPLPVFLYRPHYSEQKAKVNKVLLQIVASFCWHKPTKLLERKPDGGFIGLPLASIFTTVNAPSGGDYAR